MSSLTEPDGTFTMSKQESLDFLIVSHFPNCTLKDSPYADLHRIFLPSEPRDWEDIENTVTIDLINWAINSMSSFKFPGVDKIFLALLQKEESTITLFFKLSLKLGFVHKPRLGTYVIFILKADKPCYNNPKAYPLKSLVSFILKILEKLIDCKIRDKFLIKSPLNRFQYITNQVEVPNLH